MLIALVKKLRAAGTRIDGIGIQGHWSIQGPPLKDIENSILEYSALGLKISFTELDLTCLPNPWDLKGSDVNQNFAGQSVYESVSEWPARFRPNKTGEML